jgi:hypothetical protein
MEDNMSEYSDVSTFSDVFGRLEGAALRALNSAQFKTPPLASSRGVLSLLAANPMGNPRVRLQRGTACWEVLLDGAVFSKNEELDWAALDALVLADAHRTDHIELDAAVPADALERGALLRVKWRPDP